MDSAEPRFGVWVPVHGNWGPTDYSKEKHDASFARAKRIVVEAEKLGFATTLVAQHTINLLGQEFSQLETWRACAALSALTERIEIIAAIKPYLYHPPGWWVATIPSRDASRSSSRSVSTPSCCSFNLFWKSRNASHWR
jgi:hypothetical protein